MCIEANYFIDATGDANLISMTGFPFRVGREGDNLCQPMTLCFRVGNVDVDKFYASRERLKIAHAQSLAAGELTNPRENILVFKTPIHNVLHFNTTRVVNALIRANKRFEMLYLPGQRHGFGDMSEYFFWRMADFYSRYLLEDFENTVDISQMNND